MLRTIKNFLLNLLIKLKNPTVKIGRGVSVHLSSFLKGKIKLGKKTELFDYVRLCGKISIGDYSYLNYFSQIYASDEAFVEIGNFCSIATQVLLMAKNDHNTKSLTTMPLARIFSGLGGNDLGAPIKIGNDVWIGAQTVVLPGVEIGNGAVVGAGSVITSGTKIRPYEIWAGAPAKKIGDRFNEEKKAELLALKWWDWSQEEILKNKSLFLQ